MFTGLIETTGTVLSLKSSHGVLQLSVAAPSLAGRWKAGDSVAVNGVCLTAIDVHEEDAPTPGRLCADLAEETIRRTTLSQLQPGDLVNLELPTPSGAPMGGHVVQGHVDGTGKLVSMIPLKPDLDQTDWRMAIEVPPAIVPNIISQGSVTIDGISLTVAKIEGRMIEIAVIPHTYRATNLHSLMCGSAVNIEADVLSKYAARQALHNTYEPATVPSTSASPISLPAATPGEWLTSDYLLANGY